MMSMKTGTSKVSRTVTSFASVGQAPVMNDSTCQFDLVERVAQPCERSKLETTGLSVLGTLVAGVSQTWTQQAAEVNHSVPFSGG